MVNFTFNVTGNILINIFIYLNYNVTHNIITFDYIITFEHNIIRLTFLGPDHIAIILSPYKGVQLKKWSVIDEKPLQGPMWNDRETYFIYYACASDCIPYTFSIELIVSLSFKKKKKNDYLSLFYYIEHHVFCAILNYVYN